VPRTTYENPSPTALGARVVRVLSVPSGHVYVRHLDPPGGDPAVERLPDPLVSPHRPQSQWWPPPALEADWVLDHRDEFDVFHLHFGFDARRPEDLADLTAALRTAGKPFVYTVHDLRNPHHYTRELHDGHLDVLVPAADELVTLTPGAAREIEQRWGRAATVLPHPHVVEEPVLPRPRPEHDGFVVALHLKSLRASMEPLPVVRTLAGAVEPLPDARLRVDVHTDVMTPGFPRHDPVVADTLRRLAERPYVDLRVHDYFSDDELWDYFQAVDLSVLPYRFGTHSGWLEACHDLGTTVLTSDVGHIAEQKPCLTYHLDEDGLDEQSLITAVHAAYGERPHWRADPQERARERVQLADVHRAIYQRLLG
jgi:glycosyltransferase involved in cell wall biosynthesis